MTTKGHSVTLKRLSTKQELMGWGACKMLKQRKNEIEKLFRKKILPFFQIIENLIEFVIFMWRWILLPSYLALGFCLLMLMIKTVKNAIGLSYGFQGITDSMAIVKILGIVDMILVSNLILMVLFVGYVNFVSKINLDGEDDRPSWMDSLDYSGLKIQLLGSIVAISSVMLLRQYMDMEQEGHFDSNKLMWMIAVHLTFILSILLFSIVNWLHEEPAAADDEGENNSAGGGDEDDDDDSDLPILVAAVKFKVEKDSPKGPEYQLVLNRGLLNQQRNEVLEPGDEMHISSTGENIIDPTSGDVIGWQEDKLGTVKIVQVLERTSIAEPIGKLSGKPMVGDAVRPLLPKRPR